MGYKNLTLDEEIFTDNFMEQSDLHYLYKQINKDKKKQTNKQMNIYIYIYTHTHTHIHIHAQLKVSLCSSVIISCFSAYGASTHTPLLYLGL
jgi:hypothetical protein